MKSFRELAALPWLRRTLMRLLAIAVVALAGFGAVQGYRAWVQVKSVDLVVGNLAIAAGSSVRVNVVTSGRVPVDVRLELVQGTHAETVAVQRVTTHREPFWDMRAIASGMMVTLPAEAFAHFTSGPAILRASARGRPQLFREPPPVVKEVAVHI